MNHRPGQAMWGNVCPIPWYMRLGELLGLGRILFVWDMAGPEHAYFAWFADKEN